jgi:hypothetical protein
LGPNFSVLDRDHDLSEMISVFDAPESVDVRSSGNLLSNTHRSLFCAVARLMEARAAQQDAWIPACAGMTALALRSDVRRLRYSRQPQKA